jgi:hypothetical protein
MACTDWKAVAALDAALSAGDQSIIAAVCNAPRDPRNELCKAEMDDFAKHQGQFEMDRAAALADKCQENAR